MDAPTLLRQWREGRGLSQHDAGLLVNVHQNSWSDWESGKKTPRTEAALRLHVLTEGACPVDAWADADLRAEYLTVLARPVATPEAA
jgi:transcriptional regulator with XRE-family HTH domain